MDTLDTSPAARSVQIAAIRRLTGAQRVELAVRLSEDARAITAAGIRARHPGWSDVRVRRELLVRIYGTELVTRAWGPLGDE